MSETRPRLQLLRWRKLKRGFVVGFADVELPNGLKIADVMVVAKGGEVWVNLPSKPRIRTIDGIAQVELGADGKPVYDTVISWRTRELAEAFSERVVALVRAERPGDLPHVAST